MHQSRCGGLHCLSLARRAVAAGALQQVLAVDYKSESVQGGMGSLKLWVGLGVGESPEAGAGGCLPFALCPFACV